MKARRGLTGLLVGALVYGGAAAQGSVSREPLRLQLSGAPARSIEPPERGASLEEIERQDLARALRAPVDCQPASRVQAERPVKLAEVLRAVACASPALRQGPGLTMQAEAALERARAARLPAVGLDLRVGSTEVERTSATAGLRFDWLLFDFGGRSATLRQNEVALLALQSETASQALAALTEAAQLHASAVSARSRFDAAAINVRIAADNFRLAEGRLSAGAANLSDKLQAQTALGQARLENARAESQWLAARAALASAMALPADSLLELADTESLALLEAEPALDLRALAEEARLSHPRVLAAQARLQESRLRSEAAQAGRWGTVNLNARPARGRVLADGSLSRTASTAVEWSLPIFDGGVQRANEKEALGASKLRELDLDDAQRQVALQVWQAGQALQGEHKGASSSRLVLDSAESALRAATERYRAGVGTFADLLGAQRAAAAARLQQAEVHSSLLLAHLRLAAALGRLAGAPAQPRP